MSKKPKHEQDLPEEERVELESQPIETDDFTLTDERAAEDVTGTPPADSPPGKQYRVKAKGGFWDGVILHPRGSVVTYDGPVKDDSESLEAL